MSSVRTVATRVVLAGAFVTLAAVAVSAQQPQHPAPEIQRMTALAGRFEGQATYRLGGQTVWFTLHHVNRVIAGGFGLACHEEADVPGMGRYEADNLFGWDADRRQLHLYSVTSDPNTHDHAGTWSDATHATLHYTGVRAGQRMVETIPMVVSGPDAYHFRSTVVVAGRTAEVFEADMHRVGELSSR